MGFKAGAGPEAAIAELRTFELPLATTSLVTSVVRRGEARLVNDTRMAPDYMAVAALPATRSELVLPMRMGAEVLGVLDIQSDQPESFTPDDVAVLQLLTDQIAVALRNAQLYAAEQDRQRELARFNQQLEQLVQERTAELASAYHMLERLDRAKSDFIEVAAHELRTPLTLIKGYAQVLQSQLGKQPEMLSMVQGIVSGEERLHEVVNSLLDVTKITNATLQLLVKPVVLGPLLRRVQSEYGAALLERQLSLTFEGLDELPKILADPVWLDKAFNQLISNAIKYTPDGGRITVWGQAVGDSAVEVVVQDSGIGIDPAQQVVIFEKFYQTGAAAFHSSGKTKFKGGGPGLGLFIARGVVQAHGGRLWVESPGKDEAACPGSAFHVLLPLQAQRKD